MHPHLNNPSGEVEIGGNALAIACLQTIHVMLQRAILQSISSDCLRPHLQLTLHTLLTVSRPRQTLRLLQKLGRFGILPLELIRVLLLLPCVG